MHTSLDHLILSLRARAGLRECRAKTVYDVLQLDKAEITRLGNCGTKTIIGIQERIFEFLSGSMHEHFGIPFERGNGGCTSFGLKAFVEQMLALLDERARQIVADRYGFWDGICETLQEIGDKLGCTRERVRQIQEKSQRRLRHAVPTTVEASLLQKIFRWMSLSAHSVQVVVSCLSWKWRKRSSR